MILQKEMGKNTGSYKQGISYAIVSYVSWGLLPLFWKQLDMIPAVDILAHRIIWSSVFTLGLCLVVRRSDLFNYFSSLKSLVNLMVTGILVSVNWGVYIYAVNSGQLLEASLGYFINPLVSIALGMIFFGEKLNKARFVAFLFAIAGVAYMTVNYGHLPWIAIVLALTFGIYGLLKKKMNYDSMSALAVETALVAPVALCYLIFGSSGGGALLVTQPLSVSLQLILTGVVTALPLYWFGMAAVKIPLFSIGFFQYITPTMKLFIGIYIFHETFTATHALSFSLIWVGLIIYIVDMVMKTFRT